MAGEKLRQWLENLKRPGLSKKHLAYWIELLLESRISIADVPQEARNPAVWGAAVQANCNSAMAELARRPQERTLETLKAVVQSNPVAIEHLNHEERTYEMCMLAVGGHGQVVRLLTDEQRTPHDLAKEVATFILKTQEEGAPTEAGSGEENAAWPGPTEHAVRTERPSHAA